MLKIQVKHFVMPFLYNFQKLERDFFFFFFFLQRIGMYNKLWFESKMSIRKLFIVHFALRS